jgi:cyclopropane-fatty-acyl-phospholipid synthase
VGAAHPFSAHYDVAPDFYRLWLDPAMIYSSALWDDGDGDDDLERAQLRKLDHMTALAGAAGAERVLDVGCGWGGLLRRLVDVHAVGHGVGLTVSPSQAAWVAEHSDERIEVRLEPWAEHAADQPYDAVISIGAFEHFAQVRTSRATRVATYAEFFDRIHGLLRPGARAAIQTVARSGGRPDRQALNDLRMIDHVFPASGLPWPSEVLEAAEPRFVLDHLDVHGDHYRRTALNWVANIDAHRDEAVDLVPDEVVEDFRQCFLSGARLFERRYATLLRFGFRRIDDGRGGAG